MCSSLQFSLWLTFTLFPPHTGGKPITPTEDRTIGNGNAQHGDDNCNGATAIGETVTKTNVSEEGLKRGGATEKLRELLMHRDKGS